MALVREPEKQEMTVVSHRIPVVLAKRYQALTQRGKKMRVNIPASYIENLTKWLDEVEAELNTMNVSRLRTTTKAEE